MSDKQRTVGVGIIGGGLMGREVASAFARWCALPGMTVRPELRAVADLNPGALEWFSEFGSVVLLTSDYRELLADASVEVVYVAVPHMMHEELYVAVLEAGKDLLAEKPFGIDLGAARRIRESGATAGRFVRCSSEFPFLPGALRAMEYVRSGACGRILDIVSGFHHSSDLDGKKVANWKRQSATCGEIGVLGDLGMHVCHVPLRLGWRPKSVYAQLQKGFSERPDGRGGVTVCDTWDNATLNTWVEWDGEDVPMRLEMKRLAAGETNTWFLSVLGTEGGVRYSTKEPKTLWTFRIREGGEQVWERTDLGFGMQVKTVTGGIFEPGFPDVIQQMWAAYLLEREGELGGLFGCVTPDEAVASQEIFAAALRSQAEGVVTAVGGGGG